MISLRLNGDKVRRCAFCKYWYDPTNQHIQPSYPNQGIWKFDEKAKAMCLKKNIEMHSTTQCSKFECKIEV